MYQWRPPLTVSLAKHLRHVPIAGQAAFGGQELRTSGQPCGEGAFIVAIWDQVRHPACDTGGETTFVPANVRIEQGTTSGAVRVRWQGDGSKSMHEVQICTSDPMVEANWSYKGSFTGGKALRDSFNPDVTLWSRVCKLASAGRKGGWSDVAKLMVT